MSSPFAAWALLHPATSDIVSNFAAASPGTGAAQTQWAILAAPSATGGILGTLDPFGVTTTGWRANQTADDSWLMQNGYLTSASAFARDDTSKASLALTEEISLPGFRWMYAAGAAGAITWVEVMRLTSAGVLSLAQSASGISIGANAAASGALRLPNAQSIKSRRADNAADLNMLTYTAANVMQLGDGGAAAIEVEQLLRPGADATYDIGTLTGPLRFRSAYLSAAISIGTNPAGAGAVRLPSGIPGAIIFRNAANSADVYGMLSGNDDTLQIGPQTAGKALVSLAGDNAADLGNTAYRWRNLFLGGIIQTAALTALGAGAPATLGLIGGAGPATSTQNGWLQLQDSGGVAFFVPAWK